MKTELLGLAKYPDKEKIMHDFLNTKFTYVVLKVDEVDFPAPSIESFGS